MPRRKEQSKAKPNQAGQARDSIWSLKRHAEVRDRKTMRRLQRQFSSLMSALSFIRPNWTSFSLSSILILPLIPCAFSSLCKRREELPHSDAPLLSFRPVRQFNAAGGASPIHTWVIPALSSFFLLVWLQFPLFLFFLFCLANSFVLASTSSLSFLPLCCFVLSTSHVKASSHLSSDAHRVSSSCPDLLTVRRRSESDVRRGGHSQRILFVRPLEALSWSRMEQSFVVATRYWWRFGFKN